MQARQYMLGNSNKFLTRNTPITKAFKLDLGALTAATYPVFTFTKGSRVLQIDIVVDEAFTSGGSATVQIGLTGQSQITGAIAVATLVLGYTLGTEAISDYMIADDTLDIIIGTATLTAGKVTVYVTYTQPNESADDLDEVVVT